MIKSLFSCSFDDLFLALDYGWDLTEQNLPSFVGYKSKYTPLFVATNRKLVRTAEDLPDASARYAPTQLQRVDLIEKKEVVLNCYQFLVGYIEDAYPASKIKVMIQAAGQSKYAKARANHWTSIKALLSSAVEFIEKNQVDLMANNNMPADFLARFKQVRTDFDTLHSSWNSDDSDSYNLTDAKMKASNEAYTAFLGVTSDAQKVFRQDPAMAQKFTFVSLLSQVRGTTAAGVSGKVVIVDTKTVIPNATISIESLDKSVKTDANGRFELSPIAANTYTLKIEAEGYEPLIIEKYEVKTGTIGRLKIEMTPIAAETTATETATA